MSHLHIGQTVSRLAICAGLMGSFFGADTRAQTVCSSTAQSADTQTAEVGLQEIVVTATRRETSLQKTGLAISVITGQEQLLTGRRDLIFENLSA